MQQVVRVQDKSTDRKAVAIVQLTADVSLNSNKTLAERVENKGMLIGQGQVDWT